jgi:hypothetical protein
LAGQRPALRFLPWRRRPGGDPVCINQQVAGQRPALRNVRVLAVHSFQTKWATFMQIAVLRTYASRRPKLLMRDDGRAERSAAAVVLAGVEALKVLEKRSIS